MVDSPDKPDPSVAAKRPARVTTVSELAAVMAALPEPEVAALRLKKVLQSVFESHYSFDVEPLKKQNLGKAVKRLEKYTGVTPFVVGYVTQAALGGHLELVTLLVERGARLDIRDTIYGGTPLGWAEYGNKPEIAEYLRSVGGKP